MYGVNWIKFVEERTPAALRKPRVRSMVQAMLSPVKSLHTAFLVFKDTQERNLKITGQVCILRYWLNEFYDVDERRFEIEDYTNITAVLIWGESFNNPLYLPEFLSSKAYDFIVKAPCELQDRKVEIRNFLNTYKLAGKRYYLVFVLANGNPCAGQSAPAPNVDDE